METVNGETYVSTVEYLSSIDWEIPLKGVSDPEDILVAFEVFHNVTLEEEARAYFLRVATDYYGE